VTPVHAWAPARVALAGNPSDGYGGATVALAIANFGTLVTIDDGERLDVHSGPLGVASFSRLGALVEEVRTDGYGAPPRLLRGTLVRFWDLARSRDLDLSDARFAIGYETTIPAAVGLGGSSAIVIAATLALCERFGIAVERDELAALALSVETEELGVAAGLQDRVAQALGGLTFMDFDPARGGPRYETLPLHTMPPLLVVWDRDAGADSDLVHSDLGQRFESRESEVVDAMVGLAAHAKRARDAVRAGDAEALGAAMDASFETRRSILALDPRHVRLTELARAHGCAANYAGSGGAIVALARDGSAGSELVRAAGGEGLGCELCRPADAASVLSGAVG
jgi:glucuronokinase